MLVRFGWKFGECERHSYPANEECLPDLMVATCETYPKCRHSGSTFYSKESTDTCGKVFSCGRLV